MLDEQIDATANCMRQVFEPRNPERNLGKGVFVFLDAEFNLSRTRKVGSRKYVTVWLKHPFLSYAIAWEDKVARIGPMLSTRKIGSWNLKRLLGWILRCLRRWRAPIKKRITIVAHWAISEVRFARGIEEEDIFAPSTNFFRGHLKQWGVDWWVKDSFGIFGSSLAKLTEDTPYPKFKITQAEREDPYLHWRRRRKHFWRYAETDVTSLQWSTKHWRAKIWEKYGVDVLKCLTTATIGKRIFQTKYQGMEPLECYVAEPATTKSGKPMTEYYFNPDFWAVRRLAMRCYWGGRRETFIRGVVHGLIRHFDFVKLYMTSAALCPLPSPRSQFLPITTVEDLKNPGWVHIKHFRFKPNTMVPQLPIFDKRFRKLTYPLEGETYCTTFEALEALKVGAELEGVSGYYFTEPYEQRISEFMRELLRQCTEHRKKFGEKFFKSIGVAFVGKLVEHRLTDRIEKPWRRGQTYQPGAAFSPMIASLILGFSRSTESAVLATAKTPLYCHTDSITTLDCEPDLNHPVIKQMEELGGGLELKWTADRFWSPRAAVYWAKTKEEKYEGAHHAIHVESEDWYRGIESQLDKAKPNEYWPPRFPADWPRESSRGKPIFHGLVFIKYKPASWKDHVDRGLPLTTEIEDVSKTDFHWDDKRQVTEEERNVLGRANPTKPWRDIETLIANTPIRPSLGKRPRRIATIKERLDRQTGKVGRPKIIIPPEILTEMRRLHEKMSFRDLERYYGGRYTRSTIERALSQKC